MTTSAHSEHVDERSRVSTSDATRPESWRQQVHANESLNTQASEVDSQQTSARRRVREMLADRLDQCGASKEHVEAMVSLERKADQFFRGVALPSEWKLLVTEFRPLVCSFLCMAENDIAVGIGTYLRAWRCFCASIASRRTQSRPPTLETIMEHAVAAWIFAMKYDKGSVDLQMLADLVALASQLSSRYGRRKVSVRLQDALHVEFSFFRARAAVIIAPTAFDWFDVFCNRFVAAKGATHFCVPAMSRMSSMFLKWCSFVDSPAECGQSHRLGMAAFALSAILVRALSADLPMNADRSNVLRTMASSVGSDFVQTPVDLELQSVIVEFVCEINFGQVCTVAFDAVHVAERGFLTCGARAPMKGAAGPPQVYRV